MITDVCKEEVRGERVFILENEGLRVAVSNVGAAINGISVNARGGWRNVSPSFSSCGQRETGKSYAGATIGRVSGRIAGARFRLGGREYVLSANERGNCLHGGKRGFDGFSFRAEKRGNALEFFAVSPDGDMGFPGRLALKVTYELRGGSLTVRYSAVSDKDTLWAPTCHAYFNLEGKGDCLGNMLKINGGSIVLLGEELLNTGRLRQVAGTPFDFTDFRAVGERLSVHDGQLEAAGGYDHTYVAPEALKAQACGRESGISLEVYSDLPAMQFYSGNSLGGDSACGALRPYDYFALEPQFIPNAVNVPAFEAPLLCAGRERNFYIEYRFSARR